MMLSGEEIDMTEPVDFNRYYREKIEAAAAKWSGVVQEINMDDWRESYARIADRGLPEIPIPTPLFFECGSAQCTVCTAWPDYEE